MADDTPSSDSTFMNRLEAVMAEREEDFGDAATVRGPSMWVRLSKRISAFNKSRRDETPAHQGKWAEKLGSVAGNTARRFYDIFSGFGTMSDRIRMPRLSPSAQAQLSTMALDAHLSLASLRERARPAALHASLADVKDRALHAVKTAYAQAGTRYDALFGKIAGKSTVDIPQATPGSVKLRKARAEMANERARLKAESEAAASVKATRFKWAQVVRSYAPIMAKELRKQLPTMAVSAGAGAGARIVAAFALGAIATTLPATLITGAVTGLAVNGFASAISRSSGELMRLRNGTVQLAEGKSKFWHVAKSALLGFANGIAPGVIAVKTLCSEYAKAKEQATQNDPAYSQKGAVVRVLLTTASGIVGALSAHYGIHIFGHQSSGTGLHALHTPGTPALVPSHTDITPGMFNRPVDHTDSLEMLLNRSGYSPESPLGHSMPMAAETHLTGATSKVASIAPGVFDRPVGSTSSVEPLLNRMGHPAPQNLADHAQQPHGPVRTAETAIVEHTLPTIKMPKGFADLLTDKQFHAMPREAQVEIANAMRSSDPEKHLWAYKEASFRLFEMHKGSATHAGARLIREGLEHADAHKMLETPAAQQLSGDMAYLYQHGFGGVKQDDLKAAFYAKLAGDHNRTADHVLSALKHSNPDAVKEVEAALSDKAVQAELYQRPMDPAPVVPASAPATQVASASPAP